MGVQDNRTVQQVAVTQDISEAINQYAADSGIKVYESYDVMIDWYLTNKAKLDLPYLAPIRLNKDTGRKFKTCWIDDKLLERALKACQKDQININRFLFSSYVHFLKINGYL